jgi:O-antigen biosynthesis protein
LKIKYGYKKFNPNSLDPENIDRLAVDKIPENSRVLDIGCATGYIGEYLIREKKCLVYGVEKRSDEANIAKKILTEVISADIEQESSVKRILDLVKGEKFDVILATSVIEHLKDQSGFLRNCKKLLKQNGIIAASTPNIAHWTMRLSLLKGNFDYTEYGILDNTHLHFFTVKTFLQLFEKNNFAVKELLIDSVGGGYPRISRILAKWFPRIFAYQILIVVQNNK